MRYKKSKTATKLSKLICSCLRRWLTGVKQLHENRSDLPTGI